MNMYPFGRGKIVGERQNVSGPALSTSGATAWQTAVNVGP
jgi:hypothetical protein